MSTPNLEIAHIAAAQSQKEVTANDAFDRLDQAFCDSLTKAMADTNQTLSDEEALENYLIICTGTLTGNKLLVVPVNKKSYLLRNSTTGGFTVTIKTPSGNGVSVSADDGNVPVYCDGTDVVAQAGVVAGAQGAPYGADNPPTPADDMDDEFIGPSLAGKWTVLNTPVEHGFSTRFASRYYFAGRLSDARWSGIGQTAPTDSFAIEASVSLGWRRHNNATDRQVGLWVEQGDGKLEAFALRFVDSSGLFGFRHESWDSYSVFGAERAASNFDANRIYLRIDIDRSDAANAIFIAYWSQDGMAWRHHSNRGLGNVTIAKVAVGARSDNSNADDNGRGLFYVDWFRRAAPILVDTGESPYVETDY